MTTTRMAWLAVVGLAFLISADAPAFAQANQGYREPENQQPGQAAPRNKKAQVAQVGANTTDATTTGSSGPQKQGGGGPPKAPEQSLCDGVGQEARAACLQTVTRQ